MPSDQVVVDRQPGFVGIVALLFSFLLPFSISFLCSSRVPRPFLLSDIVPQPLAEHMLTQEPKKIDMFCPFTGLTGLFLPRPPGLWCCFWFLLFFAGFAHLRRMNSLVSSKGSPFTYLVIAIWLGTTIFWLVRMNRALAMFHGLFIIPALQVG